MESDTRSVTTINAEGRVRDFLTSQFVFDFDDLITEDTNLLKEGLVDSFGYVQLVSFLEKEFAVRFDDADLISYQLNTLRIIVSKLETKLAETK